jgi:transcriptional regulator with XRE-family HTH domain
MTADEQVEGFTRLLGTLIRVSGHTKQTLERKLGWSGGYLSRLLSGGIDLKMRHVVLICDALAMDPGELFRMAYPKRPLEGRAPAQQDSALSRDLLEMVRRASPAGPPPPPPAPLSDDELDRRIRASLVKILGEMGSAPANGEAAEETEEEV